MTTTLSAQPFVMTPGQNPFARMIILDYYDGPVSGVAEGPGGQAFRYQMLAWDIQQDVRIFSLASLPSDSFQALVTVLSRTASPHWPVWVPGGVSDSEGDNDAAQIEVVLQAAEPPEWIVAWQDLKRDGLLATRLATKQDQAKMQDIEFPLQEEASHDWFSLLNLSKSAP